MDIAFTFFHNLLFVYPKVFYEFPGVLDHSSFYPKTPERFYAWFSSQSALFSQFPSLINVLRYGNLIVYH
jgi:hypothetical protein